MINRNKRKPIYGVGVNDADYYTQKRVNGKFVSCRFYKTWQDMLKRCYYKKYQEERPTYKGCSVCDEWLVFSNFRNWMENQYWYMMELDKDLLFKGNKVYSPETCIFVSRQLNSFTKEHDATKRDYPVGVKLHKQSGKFQSRCNNPFTAKREHLGYFDCAKEAHKAWKARKHELACHWADIVGDERLKHALRNRYL